MNSKSILSFLCFCLICQSCFSQSKKVEIAKLNFQIDSLNNVIQLQNRKIEFTKTQVFELEDKLIIASKNLVESQKKHAELKMQNIEMAQLKKVLDSIRVRCVALQMSMNECADKSASVRFVENVMIKIDTLELFELANKYILEPCPNENVNGETEDICTTEFTCKEFFEIGSKRYLVAMVNYSYNGCRFCSGKSMLLLFQVDGSILKLLDHLQIDECCTHGLGLQFADYKVVIGKKFAALFLYGETGGAGANAQMDYLVTFLNDKICLVYKELGDGYNVNDGIVWKNTYSFIPSNSDIYEMKIKTEYIKERIGKPDSKSIINKTYRFSFAESRFIEIIR